MPTPKPPGQIQQVKQPGNQQQGEKKPKKPEKSVKDTLRETIEAEVYKRKLERFLIRRDVEKELGPGKIQDFVDEVENGYTRSAPVGEESDPAKPYDRPLKERPKLKKVSKRKIAPQQQPKQQPGPKPNPPKK